MSILAQDTIVISPSTVNKIESEIEELRGATDCADVVANKAALDAYDTSKLTDQSIVKVLQDESQNDAQTYYRYSKSSDSFTLIGELGPYYTKAEDDELLAEKLDKTDTASQVYGTDAQGNQTTYNKDDFGKVDDVQVNGTSIVSNKIANLGTMASEDKDDYLPLSGGTMTGDVDISSASIKFGQKNNASNGAGIKFSSYGLTFGYRNSQDEISPLWRISPATGEFTPTINGSWNIGSSNYKVKNTYTTKLNNGADINIPNQAGTMALTSDVEQKSGVIFRTWNDN